MLGHPKCLIFTLINMSINQTCSCLFKWTNRKVCRKPHDRN